MPPPIPPEPSPSRWLVRALPALAFIGLVVLLANAQPRSAQASMREKTAPTANLEPSGDEGQEAGEERSAKETEEYTVKADILCSFLKYSKFPEGTFAHKKSPIVVLTIGDDPFGPLLKAAFADKKFDGRSVQIRRLKRAPAPSRIYAHLIFAHGLTEAVRSKLIVGMRSRPCLLVADAPGFAEAGGFINFYSDAGKVRFEINAQRLKSTGVQLKAELLKLARLVGEVPDPVDK